MRTGEPIIMQVKKSLKFLFLSGGGGIHFLGDDWGKKLFEYPFNPVKYPERGDNYLILLNNMY